MSFRKTIGLGLSSFLKHPISYPQSSSLSVLAIRQNSSIPALQPQQTLPKNPLIAPIFNSDLLTRKFPTVYIIAGRHNTKALFSDANGNVITHCSGGLLGLRKTARGTQDAGYQVAVQMSEKAVQKGYVLNEVNAVLKLKGFGPGRAQSIRGLQSAGWSFISVVDITPFKFGGARPPKRRRI